MTEPLLLTATQISTFLGTQLLTKASGFFFERDERLYLVTSRHVRARRAERRTAPTASRSSCTSTRRT